MANEAAGSNPWLIFSDPYSRRNRRCLNFSSLTQRKTVIVVCSCALFWCLSLFREKDFALFWCLSLFRDKVSPANFFVDAARCVHIRPLSNWIWHTIQHWSLLLFHVTFDRHNCTEHIWLVLITSLFFGMYCWSVLFWVCHLVNCLWRPFEENVIVNVILCYSIKTICQKLY